MEGVHCDFIGAIFLIAFQYQIKIKKVTILLFDALVRGSRTKAWDARGLQDTLTISPGRDKSLVPGREKVSAFSKTRTIGSNTVDTRGFKIVVRNKKSQPVKVTLVDQVPLSVVGDISVNTIELSKGIIDEKTGKVSWEIWLEPQQQTALLLQYEVKYPKKERVILE